MVLIKYDIPKESYSIGEEYQDSKHHKICLIKTPIGKWNTCLKLYDGVFDSIYHPSLTTAIIKFLKWIAPSDEKYPLMLQDFLNLNTENLTKINPIKYRRKKR